MINNWPELVYRGITSLLVLSMILIRLQTITNIFYLWIKLFASVFSPHIYSCAYSDQMHFIIYDNFPFHCFLFNDINTRSIRVMYRVTILKLCTVGWFFLERIYNVSFTYTYSSSTILCSREFAFIVILIMGNMK